MDEWTLDQILENDDAATVVLSNSKNVIVWTGGTYFEVWHRVPDSDTTFFFSDAFLGNSFNDPEIARAIATDYALKSLPV